MIDNPISPDQLQYVVVLSYARARNTEESVQLTCGLQYPTHSLRYHQLTYRIFRIRTAPVFTISIVV